MDEFELTDYQEGFADGLRWVLGNCELDDVDRERIESILDGD